MSTNPVGLRVPQLSDKGTRAFKLRFVASLAAVVVAVMLATDLFSKPRPTPLTSGLVLVAVLVVLAWTVRRNPIWALADEVVDEGNSLVVRRRSAHVRVAFDDIAAIDRDSTSTRRVRLGLVRAIPPFGTEVLFRPRDSASMTTDELNRLIEDLRARAPRIASTQNGAELHDTRTTAGDRAARRTFTRKRVIIGCVALLFLLAAGNYALELKMFAPFDKQVMVGCLIVAAIVIHFFQPTTAEMDLYLDARIAKKKLGQKSQ